VEPATTSYPPRLVNQPSFNATCRVEGLHGAHITVSLVNSPISVGMVPVRAPLPSTDLRNTLLRRELSSIRVLNYQLALLRRELSIIRVLNYSTSSLRNTHLPGSVSSIVQRDIQGGGR
jgi:hypothetical protein